MILIFLGAIWGSFANVCIYRLPINKGVIMIDYILVKDEHTGELRSKVSRLLKDGYKLHGSPFATIDRIFKKERHCQSK